MDSIITLTKNDLYNAAYNGGCGIAFSIGSRIITAAIDHGLHSALNIERDESVESRTIQVLAIGAGFAPALYFAPQVMLVSFTARKVAELFALSLVLHFVPLVNSFSGRAFGTTLFTSVMGSYPALLLISHVSCAKATLKAYKISQAQKISQDPYVMETV